MKIINSIEKPFRQTKIEVLEKGVYWNTTFDFEIYINTFIDSTLTDISWENDNSIEYEKGYHIVENNTLTHDNKWVCAWDIDKWELVNFYYDNPSNRLRLRKKD